MENTNSTFYFGQTDDPVIDGRNAETQRGSLQQFSIAAQSTGSVLDPTAAEFTYNMGVHIVQYLQFIKIEILYKNVCKTQFVLLFNCTIICINYFYNTAYDLNFVFRLLL